MGRRGVNDSPKPYQEPVAKIEVSEKHVGRRVIAAAVFLLIGVGAFAYFIVGLVRGEPGWTEITALSSRVSCSGDFVFLYEVGAESGAAKSEKRDVTAAYTEAAEKAYWMFENVRAESTSEETDGESLSVIHGAAAAGNHDSESGAAVMGSVRFLNDNPNQTVTVDAPLYEAFAKLEAAGGRWLYLPAVYREYENLFQSESDLMAAEFDPQLNEIVASYVKEVLSYANDPASVSLKLLGENQVQLSVSEAYLSFAEENGIDSFIDFGWMKNAFIADYLAETLTAAGFTRGSISSFDGFVRNLDGRELSYSFNIYDRVADSGEASAGAGIRQLAVLEYNGPLSLVYLHDYPMTSLDQQRYYQMADGEMRTVYIDPRDGLCRSSVSSMISYSYETDAGCADILLSMVPVYIADEFDADAVEAMAGKAAGAYGSAAAQAEAGGSAAASVRTGGSATAPAGTSGSATAPAGTNGSASAPAGTVYSIYRQGDVIRVNDPAAVLTEVSEGYTVELK